MAFALTASPAAAQTVNSPYVDGLLRLSEILGAVHHLREVCGANEGQLWREQMSEVLGAEEPPAQLRGRMVATFNSSYRDYQRTYAACTASAKTVADRFLGEGATITKQLAAENSPADGIKTDENPVKVIPQ